MQTALEWHWATPRVDSGPKSWAMALSVPVPFSPPSPALSSSLSSLLSRSLVRALSLSLLLSFFQSFNLFLLPSLSCSLSLTHTIRPQKLGHGDVILNSQAQSFWKSIKNLMVRAHGCLSRDQ